MLTALLFPVLFGCHAEVSTNPGVTPPGEDARPATRALVIGARALQPQHPPAALDIHLVGFHPMKEAPQHQMEAHHFCRQVNEDFAQCALFDGDGATANLNGVEYIVSARLHATLPASERQYWHPHNGEILSGQLLAPGLPEAAEKALMRRKINSYGKTWHTWRSHRGESPGDALPLGPAELAWSFNRDGEIDPALVRARDQRVGVDTARRRVARQDMLSAARPQDGVDALRAAFPQSTPIPGVVDKDPTIEDQVESSTTADSPRPSGALRAPPDGVSRTAVAPHG